MFPMEENAGRQAGAFQNLADGFRGLGWRRTIGIPN